MTPTPTQLRDPILASIGKLTRFQVGVEVSSSDVTDDVILCLGYVPDDLKKARNNVNFAATQNLRSAGLLVPAGKRGMWALSQEGVAAAEALAGITPTVVPVKVAAIVAPTVSPWAEDPAGVVVFQEILEDSYAEDNYIKVLGISQVRCFGGFRESEPFCMSCPVAGSCQAHQFKTFSEVAAGLNRRGNTRPVALPSTEPDPTSDVQGNTRDSLAAILDSLTQGSNRQDNVESRKIGRDLAAPVDSVCYLCNKTLPEGSIITHIHGKGARHKGVCP